MTQDEIIRMAREAGFQSVYLADAPIGRSYQFLERFAALVAAREQKDYDTIFAEGSYSGKMVEREACAKVCEENGKDPDDHKSYEGYDEGYQDGSNNCAAAIRARNENASS